MITLDEQKNVYVHAGQSYARVSTILQATGVIDAQWYTEEGALRGTYVHEACALYDKQDLHWESLDDKIKPYVEGYINFRKDSNEKFTDFVGNMEKSFFSAKHRVAGTPDRIVFEGGKVKRTAILDIKTGDSAFVGVQTAAYEAIFREQTGFGLCAINRYCVRLFNTGKYKLIPLVDGNDRTIWQSAVNVYRFKNPLKG